MLMAGREQVHDVGIFKALGQALGEAVKVTGTDIPSTKGIL